jgi:hypothetical protein
VAPPLARRRPKTSENDLILELTRQHTLLQVMAARMRETAEVLEHSTRPDPRRIERALNLHRRYLIEVHHPNDQLVQSALAKSRRASVRALLARCAVEHLKAEEFQRDVRAIVEKSGPITPVTAKKIAEKFRAEADRVEEDHEAEDEVYAQLDELIPLTERQKLFEQIRRFDVSRAGAETALIAWASQIHPAAD